MQKRLFIILGILVVLAFVFMILNIFTNNDDSRTTLDTIFNTNNQIAVISKTATERASTYNLKVAAANTSALTSSDGQALLVYYEKRYGKKPKEFKLAEDQDPAAQLKVAEDGTAFDNLYKDLATTSLEANIARMESLQNQTSRQDLKDLLNQAITNQTSALNQLNAAP